MENSCKELWYEQELKLCEEKLDLYKAQLLKAVKALHYYGWEFDDQGYYARSVLEDLGYTQQKDKRV